MFIWINSQSYRGHPKRKGPWIFKHTPPQIKRAGSGTNVFRFKRVLFTLPPPMGEALRYSVKSGKARHRNIKKLQVGIPVPSKISKSQRPSGFWVRHSNNRRQQANVWKHPPPRDYAKYKNDDPSRCGGGGRFVNKTNQKTGIRETLNAFPRSKRLEAVRSI